VWKTKRKPDEYELRIIKTLEEGNQPHLHLSFFKGIIPSLQNFKEEETLEFQMGVLQLIAHIKHRKPSKFSSQSLPMYNQPFHTSSHVGGNNPLLVYASTMDPHSSNITESNRWLLTPEWCRARRDKNRQYATHFRHLRYQTNMGSIILHGQWCYNKQSVSINLRKLKSHRLQLWFHTRARVCVVKKNLNYYRMCHH